MKKVLFLFALFVCISSAMAEDIYLKNGTYYLNIKITFESDEYVSFTGLTVIDEETFRQLSQKYAKTDIDSILRTPYNPGAYSVFVDNPSAPKILQYKSEPLKWSTNKPKYTYPNTPFLLLCGLSIFIAWDSFADASDISSQIDEFDKYDINMGHLESAKTRKVVIGAVATLTALISIIVSFESVKIETGNNQVTISYNF
jgi:hypothetical protein